MSTSTTPEPDNTDGKTTEKIDTTTTSSELDSTPPPAPKTDSEPVLDWNTMLGTTGTTGITGNDTTTPGTETRITTSTFDEQLNSFVNQICGGVSDNLLTGIKTLDLASGEDMGKALELLKNMATANLEELPQHLKLQEELQDALQLNASLQNTAEQLQKKILKFNNLINKLTTLNSVLKDNEINLNVEVKSLNKELKKLLTEIQQFGKNAAKKDRELQRLHSQIGALNDKNAELHTELRQSKSSVNILQLRVRQLSPEHRNNAAGTSGAMSGSSALINRQPSHLKTTQAHHQANNHTENRTHNRRPKAYNKNHKKISNQQGQRHFAAAKQKNKTKKPNTKEPNTKKKPVTGGYGGGYGQYPRSTRTKSETREGKD